MKYFEIFQVVWGSKRSSIGKHGQRYPRQMGLNKVFDFSKQNSFISDYDGSLFGVSSWWTSDWRSHYYEAKMEIYCCNCGYSEWMEQNKVGTLTLSIVNKILGWKIKANCFYY